MRDKVTVVGSYNVGLFLKGDRLPVKGETVICDAFHEGGGGKGSNQAVAASLFGADTAFVGRIGADKYGNDALAMYERLGISTDYVSVDDSTHSGISVILIDKTGANLISVAPGANYRLSTEDIDRAAEAMRASAIVGFQLENRLDTVSYAIRQARALGARVLLDPAPAVPLPGELLGQLDYIKPNEVEAAILTGIAVTGPDSAVDAGRWLVDRGVGTAVITLGEAGAIVVTSHEARHYPAPHIDAVDTTGAGDIFSGALMAALAKGDPIAEAVEFANHAAALSGMKLGVIESIPQLAQVRAFMAGYEGKA
jgi:ribokinase